MALSKIQNGCISLFRHCGMNENVSAHLVATLGEERLWIILDETMNYHERTGRFPTESEMMKAIAAMVNSEKDAED